MALPYNKDESKKVQVAAMFNSIAHKYDFLNHFLSLNIDKLWRKKAVRLLKDRPNRYILDIATGTADFALEAMKLNPEKIVGIDISVGMLEIGKKKIIKTGLDDKIDLQEGDAEDLKFSDSTFDIITVAFGVRNFENLETGLNEMYRVLKENGSVAILEFSKPGKFPVKQLYNFYFKFILPLIGRLFSRDKSAYTYLPESVGEFPDGERFIKILDSCGFKNCRQYRLSFGIASIYYCEK